MYEILLHLYTVGGYSRVLCNSCCLLNMSGWSSSFHSFCKPLLVAHSHLVMFCWLLFKFHSAMHWLFLLICLNGHLIFTVFQTIVACTITPCHVCLAIFVMNAIKVVLLEYVVITGRRAKSALGLGQRTVELPHIRFGGKVDSYLQ